MAVPRKDGPSLRNGEALQTFLEDGFRTTNRKLDDLIEQLNHHLQGEGHPLLSQRVEVLEEESKHNRTHAENKPLQTWQVVAGAIGLFLSCSWIAVGVANLLLGLLNVFHLVPK